MLGTQLRKSVYITENPSELSSISRCTGFLNIGVKLRLKLSYVWQKHNWCGKKQGSIGVSPRMILAHLPLEG